MRGPTARKAVLIVDDFSEIIGLFGCLAVPSRLKPHASRLLPGV